VLLAEVVEERFPDLLLLSIARVDQCHLASRTLAASAASRAGRRRTQACRKTYADASRSFEETSAGWTCLRSSFGGEMVSLHLVSSVRGQRDEHGGAKPVVSRMRHERGGVAEQARRHRRRRCKGTTSRFE